MSLFDFLKPINDKKRKEQTRERTARLVYLEAQRYKEEAREATNELLKAFENKKEKQVA